MNKAKLPENAGGGSKNIRVMLVGNPNAGKTSLFNLLTGKRLRVGNWEGVTVAYASAVLPMTLNQQQKVTLVDLPGLKSLVEYDNSCDVNLARDEVLQGRADLILNVVDASDMERQLYLTTQLLDLGLPMVVLLSCTEMAEKKGFEINTNEMQKHLGCAVIKAPIKDNNTVEIIKNTIAQQLQFATREKSETHSLSSCFLKYMINEKKEIKTPIYNLSKQIKGHLLLTSESKFEMNSKISSDFMGLHFLEGGSYFRENVGLAVYRERDNIRNSVFSSKGIAIDTLIAELRYQFVENVLNSAVSKLEVTPKEERLSFKLDSLLQGKLGFFIFLLVMYVVFFITINVGGELQEIWNNFLDVTVLPSVSELTASAMMSLPIQSLFVGVVSGVGAVISFIPLLFVMNLCIGVLEQSGYMARAMFSVDHLMGYLGLQGKALIPFVLGFGCNVPAIEATRTLDSKRERRLVMLMNPFISCGARLPVYTLFAVIFFPDRSALLVFTLYLTGIFFSILTGFVIQRTLLPGSRTPLLVTLPTLRIPSLSLLLSIAWFRISGFIRKAGKVVVPVVVVLSLLNTNLVSKSSTPDDTLAPHSLLEQIGKTVTPIFSPMGIEQSNWPATVALLTGFLAKEVVIGTLNSVYGQHSFLDKKLSARVPNLEEQNLAVVTDGLDAGVAVKMKVLFGSQIAAFAYLLFVLLYAPCVAVMASVYKEAGVKWMLFSFTWSTLLAYSVATCFYQIMTFSLHSVFSSIWLLGSVIFYWGIFVLLRFFYRDNNYSGLRLAEDDVSVIRLIEG